MAGEDFLSFFRYSYVWIEHLEPFYHHSKDEASPKEGRVEEELGSLVTLLNH